MPIFECVAQCHWKDKHGTVPRQLQKAKKVSDEPEDEGIGIFDPVPSGVRVALSYTEMCLHSMRPIVIDEDSTADWGEEESNSPLLVGLRQKLERPEMHPKQEAAFDHACNLLGCYFADQAKQFKSDD